MSQRAICQSRHMSRISVSEVFRIAEEQNITYADVESKTSAEVYSMFYSDKYPEETTYDITTSRLDFSGWKRMKNLAG